jgi:hypothetical protein
METKAEKLRRLLCKLLGCEDFFPKPPAPAIHVTGNLETFHYDGYDVEVHLFPENQALQVQVYLKGTLALIGECKLGAAIEWHYGSHHPSYKTRKYMQEYATKRLNMMKDTQ